MTTWLDAHRDRRLRDQLADLPELAATAATAIRGERLGGEGGARCVPGPRPPLNVDAAAVSGFVDLPVDTLDASSWPVRGGGRVWVDGRGHVLADDELPGSALSVLAAWVRLAEAELLDDHTPGWGYSEPTPVAEVPTVSSECAWLLRHVVWILDQQWVVELADDVHRLTEDCRRILRMRPEYRPTCQRAGCGGNLVDEGSGLWRCDNCNHTAGDRSRLGLRETVARQKPMTVGGLHEAFGVTASKMAGWVRSGRLRPVSDDDQRYYVSEVLELVSDVGVSHMQGHGKAKTLAELAHCLDVPVKTLHHWHSKGLIEPVTEARVKRERLFSVDDVASVARRMGRVS